MSLSIDVLALGGNERYKSEQIIKFIQALRRHAGGKLSEENASIIAQLCNLHVGLNGEKIEASFFTISKSHISEIPRLPGYTESKSNSTDEPTPSCSPASGSSSSSSQFFQPSP